ncbi:hypothetical protein PWT90_02655 [Aphanocladium album]|nr:hypothetical protein PWT90_02655 [Aphanocladium album]
MPRARCSRRWRQRQSHPPPKSLATLHAAEAASQLAFRPTPPKARWPARFIESVAQPLVGCHDPYASPEILQQCRVSTTALDFATGHAVGATPPVLMEPMSLTRIGRWLEKAKPWSRNVAPNVYSYEPVDLVGESPAREGCLPQAEADCQYRQANQLAHFVQRYSAAHLTRDTEPSVQRRASWYPVDEELLKYWFYLQPEDAYESNTDFLYGERFDEDPNLWSIETMLMNFVGTPVDRKVNELKPHAICHVLDSTPLVNDRIRTVELRAVVFAALMAHDMDQYNHLSNFAVSALTSHLIPWPCLLMSPSGARSQITVLSYWNRSVRVVQGLVNFKQFKVDLRVSATQSFPDGFRHDADSYQRFLQVLAYNCGTAMPLPRERSAAPRAAREEPFLSTAVCTIDS